MSVGPGGRPEDAPLGLFVRIKGLPDGVTLSGGYTNAGRPWTVPLANGERAWMVPLRVLDDIKIEISSGLSGNLDLLFGLVDDDGVVLSERTVEVRVTPRSSRRRAASSPVRRRAWTPRSRRLRFH